MDLNWDTIIIADFEPSSKRFRRYPEGRMRALPSTMNESRRLKIFHRHNIFRQFQATIVSSTATSSMMLNLCQDCCQRASSLQPVDPHRLSKRWSGRKHRKRLNLGRHISSVYHPAHGDSPRDSWSGHLDLARSILQAAQWPFLKKLGQKSFPPSVSLKEIHLPLDKIRVWICRQGSAGWECL